MIWLLVLPVVVNAQDVNVLFKKAQGEMAAFDENSAFLTYAKIIKAEPSNLSAPVPLQRTLQPDWQQAIW